MVRPSSAHDRTAAAATADLTDAQRSQLTTYLSELDRWNLRLNLTAVPASDRWQRHVVEALLLLGTVPLDAGAEVIDVGSGPGVPGIAIAVARPDVHVTLLESDLRRCGFLTHVAGVIGLRSLVVINRRAEDGGADAALREQFDVATARALAPPAVLCELTLPFVRVGGAMAALVSDAGAALPRASPAAAMLGGAAPEARPGVLLVSKAMPTPPRFPRRAGVPARRPLG